jgi:hypothetical protein|tara:strand:- start:1476 stop:1751 length:276 start_codon:yes stop_codon:yes gene_type:complete
MPPPIDEGKLEDTLDKILKRIEALESREISIPPVVLEIYDDINNDGFYQDGDRRIPVPVPTGVVSNQEVFRIQAHPPNPLKIRVEGLLKAK